MSHVNTTPHRLDSSHKIAPPEPHGQSSGGLEPPRASATVYTAVSRYEARGVQLYAVLGPGNSPTDHSLRSMVGHSEWLVRAYTRARACVVVVVVVVVVVFAVEAFPAHKAILRRSSVDVIRRRALPSPRGAPVGSRADTSSHHSMTSPRQGVSVHEVVG